MMEKRIFAKEMLSLFKFFRRSELPDDSVIDEWYDILKYLPSNAFSVAIRKLKDQERLPYNIPKAIKTAWSEFNAENPKKSDPIGELKPCEECNSSGGYLVLLYHREIRQYHFRLVMCSQCDNWKKIGSCSSLRKTSASKLKARGLAFKPFNQVLPARPDPEAFGIPKSNYEFEMPAE